MAITNIEIKNQQEIDIYFSGKNISEMLNSVIFENDDFKLVRYVVYYDTFSSYENVTFKVMK